MTDAARPTSHQQLGRTFISQQRVIGILPFFLPAFLVGWSLISGEGIRGSLSEYYYTPVRDVFVGALCALSLFLWSYRGYHPTNPELRLDPIVAKIASVAVALVALAPLRPRQDGECTLLQCVFGDRTTDWIHNAAAVVFLLALATLCLVLFPMSAIEGDGSNARMVVYGVCGAVIAVVLALMVLWKFLPVDVYFALGRYKPILILETIALVAFGVAWLLRSRVVERAALAKDNPAAIDAAD